MTELLPQYDEPPVTETVLGIEFRPLAQWNLPHFGLLWSKFRGKYPKYSVQPPIPEESRGPGLQISFSPLPPVRCWFIDKDDRWLIQVQDSRFISNWRKRDDSQYPSYQLFRGRFVEQYSIFQDFLKDEGITEPSLFQADVTYINHIDLGSDFRELPSAFPVFSELQKGEFLPIPQGGGSNFVYLMPESRGRLFINVQSVLNHETAKELLQMTVTAKTLIASNASDAAVTSELAVEALDYSHEWVVRGFTDFTSPKMHKVWGRTQ